MKKIAIHSVPRSGSSWLGSIVDSHPEVVYKYQPLFSYQFKGAINEASTESEIAHFFDQLYTSSDSFIDRHRQKESGIQPTFEKREERVLVYKEVRYHHVLENLIAKAEDLKLVLLIRNPLSVLSSWYKAPKEFRKDLGWEFNVEWRNAELKNDNLIENFYGFNKWLEATLLFEKLVKEYPDKCTIVRYIDLINDPIDTTTELFSFLDLSFEESTQLFLENHKNIQDPYSVIKSKKTDDDWKDFIPSDIVEEVRDVLEKKNLTKYLV